MDESKSAEKWFIFPTTNPENEDVEVSLEDTRVRVHFIMSIYEWICVDTVGTAEFERRLTTYHDNFVDFESETWRLKEFGSFWGSLFACAFDQDLMNRWLYAEKLLFEFRMKTYFSGYKDTMMLLSRNATRLVDISVSNTLEDQLKPKGNDKNIFFRVPWERAHSLIYKDEISMKDGFVYLDWRHIGEWVWCQIENNFSIALRNLCPKSGDIEMDGEKANEGEEAHFEHLFIRGCVDQVEDAMKVEEELKRLKRKRDRALGGGPAGCITDIEDLVSTAKDKMPPCQSMHIYHASVNGKHPKYEARKSLSMFSLEAGHEVDEVEKALFLLWGMDANVAEDTNRFPRGFTMEEFLKQCKDVSGIHKAMNRSFESIKAYGCGGMAKRGMCPFTAKKLDKGFLRWLGHGEEAIREIEETTSKEWESSAKCTVAFKSKYPQARSLTIKHPNMYYREAGRAGDPWTKKQKEKK